MLKKLKSLLKSHRGLLLTLAFKALVFSGLLFLSLTVSRWWLIFFLATAFYFYFQSFLNSRRFLFLFLIVLAISIFPLFVSNVGSWLLAVTLFSGLLFFLLLGIKNLIFVHRHQISYFLNGLLFLAIFICFFSIDSGSGYFILKYLSVFVAVFLIFTSPINPITPIGPISLIKLIAVGLSFITIQILWAINLLPFSFLNSASLALLAVLILEDFAVHRLSGTMNRRLILRNITFFLILGLIIFAATEWSL